MQWQAFKRLPPGGLVVSPVAHAGKEAAGRGCNQLMIWGITFTSPRFIVRGVVIGEK